MRLHFETRTVAQAYRYMDRLGYLLCHDCTPEANRHEMGFADKQDTETCDKCGRRVCDVTIETTATVPVEYVTCKIF